MTTNDNALLSLENIGISFGGLRAVDALDLTVKKGQIVGLIGPNGAGKTTVFNMITGVYKPTDGVVRWKGEAISGLPPYKIAQRGILRTFQTIRLFTGMSVLENVLAGQHMRTKQTWFAGLLATPAQRREEKALRKECMDILERLNLAHVAHEVATSLPYGIQRRVEMARTLAASPELLILDEPAAGLNDNESAELNKTILDIRDSGVTVLLVEHDMNVVMNVTDHIVVISFGRKIAEGGPEAIRTNPDVIEAYLGKDDDDDDEELSA
ncbi:ABC transporter ATP-binding protein [Marinobacter sp. C2H3]|uniref:ABC transporter ATP-binding protein n=1 Tax=Marinobacter sp. C2H3 TaxID=3119003 RepID=UPI00300ECF0E